MTFVVSGEEAIAAFERRFIDLIVSDVCIDVRDLFRPATKFFQRRFFATLHVRA
jgi:CheY-like chemotaxis protein